MFLDQIILLVEGENQTDGNAWNKACYWEKHKCANPHMHSAEKKCIKCMYSALILVLNCKKC